MTQRYHMKEFFKVLDSSKKMKEKIDLLLERHNNDYFINYELSDYDKIKAAIRPLKPIQPEFMKWFKDPIAKNMKLAWVMDRITDKSITDPEFITDLSKFRRSYETFKSTDEVKIEAAKIYAKYCSEYKKQKVRKGDNAHKAPQQHVPPPQSSPQHHQQAQKKTDFDFKLKSMQKLSLLKESFEKAANFDKKELLSIFEKESSDTNFSRKVFGLEAVDLKKENVSFRTLQAMLWMTITYTHVQELDQVEDEEQASEHNEEEENSSDESICFGKDVETSPKA